MKKFPDLPLLLCYLLASGLSLVVLSSIAPDRFPQQLIMFLLGLALLFYLSSQESELYQVFAPVGYLLSLLMLTATLLVGETIRGSTRWIPLGSFQLQPGELVKPLLILSFAYFLDRFPPRSGRFLLLNLLLFALPTFLIFRQPDLGTALVICAIFITQLFVAGMPLWFLAFGATLAGLMFKYLPLFLHGYQLDRLTSFLDPRADPLGSGYNVIQSVIAVGSGGIWGKGLGHGTQSHLRFLPERHTDFIFASLAEELGLVGSLLVLGILLALLFRLLSLATQTSHPRSRLVYLGVFGYLFFQSFVNIGMNLGLVPVTGVTLPLISYGGSSILAIAVSLALASSQSKSHSPPTLLEIK